MVNFKYDDLILITNQISNCIHVLKVHVLSVSNAVNNGLISSTYVPGATTAKVSRRNNTTITAAILILSMTAHA